MKKYIALISLVILSACAAPATITTPAGKAAYISDQLINSLGIFQDAAIGSNDQKILSDSSTKLIVTFVKASVNTARQTPSGWKVTISTGLDSLVKALPAADAQKYSAYIGLLKTMIGNL